MERKTVWNMYDHKCYYCGCDLDFDTYQMDHFVSKEKAWAMGIPNRDNLVPACPDCNQCKSDLSIEEFRKKLENDLLEGFHGRMIQKYYKIDRKPIIFWFENQFKNIAEGESET